MYFDRGVIEVVTPVIELAPGCTARVVRNLWEQIQFVRDELTKWEGEVRQARPPEGLQRPLQRLVRAEARASRTSTATSRSSPCSSPTSCPFPLALVGTNRRSTGVGVRPRGKRIEVTADFTPDPGLMIATATLIVGIVRDGDRRGPPTSSSMLDEPRSR